MKKRSQHRFFYYGFIFIALVAISAFTSTELDRPGRVVIREALTDRAAMPAGQSEGPSSSVPLALMRRMHDPARTSTDGLCQSIEFPGKGRTRLTTDEKSRLESALAVAKEELLAWLITNKGRFAPATAELMRSRVQAIKLRSPTPGEDPDLSWRGIGVWARERDGSPVLRLGPGFATLAERDPERARFELIRLVAMGWAPCELKTRQPWGEYLKCMGISESEKGCGVGDYSEAGWAVSSAVATLVANTSRMGCKLPAFANPAHAACPQALLKEDRHEKLQPQSRAQASTR